MKRAFSLIELIVVIGIVALLTVISVAGFTQQQRRARDARRIADGGSIGIALENYRTLRNSYINELAAGTYTYDGVVIPYNHNEGVIVGESLKALVNEGLINTLPRDPQRVAGITAITGNNPPFCLDYTYKSNTTADMGGNTLNAQWRNAHGGENVGPRAWVLYIATELTGATNATSPLDSSVPNTLGQNWCEAQRGYAYILGPKS